MDKRALKETFFEIGVTLVFATIIGGLFLVIGSLIQLLFGEAALGFCVIIFLAFLFVLGSVLTYRKHKKEE